MTLINKKKVKQMVNEHNKQISEEYLAQLDYRVRQLIIKSIQTARHFKRLKASELL